MRHRRAVTPLMLITAMILALPTRAQQKPLTQEQVQGMVRDGLGDETGAKAIEQRGIDFAPTEDFLQTIESAGANGAFLAALRGAKHPRPAGEATKRPLNQVQVFALLAGQVPSHRVSMLVKERGIDFEPTDDYLAEIRLVGGGDELIGALKNAKVTKPEHIDPALQARQAEVCEHVARGAELLQKKRYADAEAEDRAALRLDPQNADLHVDLGTDLGEKGERDAAVAEFREALRLDPDNDTAHYDLGVEIGSSGNRDAAISEYREALRINPGNESAHINLGAVLSERGDVEGAAAEFREAANLNPKSESAHLHLGGHWPLWVIRMRQSQSTTQH